MLKAVIFDMDGVISDTLLMHTEAESKTFLNHGIHITPAELIARYNAVPDTVMYQEIFSEIGEIHDEKKLAKEKLQRFKELAKEKLHEIPGAIKLIKRLKESNFLLGVAS